MSEEIELPEEFGADIDLNNRMKSIFEVPDEVRAEERALTLKAVAEFLLSLERMTTGAKITAMVKAIKAFKKGIWPDQSDGR